MEKPCQSSISKLAKLLTPFEIEEIGKIKEPIGTGSREDHGYAKTFTK